VALGCWNRIPFRLHFPGPFSWIFIVHSFHFLRNERMVLDDMRCHKPRHVVPRFSRQRLPNDLAERRVDQINKAGRSVYFAWAGGIKPGDPYYYRVQTPLFLIEFDGTQNKPTTSTRCGATSTPTLVETC
jgi:hypothetical protein